MLIDSSESSLVAIKIEGIWDLGPDDESGQSLVTVYEMHFCCMVDGIKIAYPHCVQDGLMFCDRCYCAARKGLEHWECGPEAPHGFRQ